jgi:hypothetical protein
MEKQREPFYEDRDEILSKVKRDDEILDTLRNPNNKEELQLIIGATHFLNENLHILRNKASNLKKQHSEAMRISKLPETYIYSNYLGRFLGFLTGFTLFLILFFWPLAGDLMEVLELYGIPLIVLFVCTIWRTKEKAKINRRLREQHLKDVKVALENANLIGRWQNIVSTDILKIQNSLKKSPIHPNYINSRSLNYFYECIDTGKATSLRECMLLTDQKQQSESIRNEISYLESQVYTLESEVNSLGADVNSLESELSRYR